jgi:Tetratricopeptide repeat
MTNSTYSQPLPDDWRPKAASGHRADGSIVPGKIHVYPEMAAAGLWTTPTDLAKLIVRPTADVKFELLPIADSTFIRKDSNLKYTFVRSAAGASEIQITFPRGDSVTAPKVSADALIPFEIFMSGNIDKALDAYRKIKKEQPDNAAVTEGRINSFGYGFMRAKKLPEAIAYFKLNVEFYPNSWNVYDSLAEAYMTNGDKELAIANYKKSLELNPGNTNATEMLKKLSGASQ